MINRNVLKGPVDEFDWFNDYKDTMGWLRNLRITGPPKSRALVRLAISHLQQRKNRMDKKRYLVRDPRAVYDIYEISLYAESEEDARVAATAAMCGCLNDDIDDVVLGQFFADLIVVEDPIVITWESIEMLQGWLDNGDHAEVSRALEDWYSQLVRIHPENLEA